MIAELCLMLVLCLAATPAPSIAPAAPATQAAKLPEVQEKFARAAAGADAAQRSAALGELVALGDPRAMEALISAFSRASVQAEERRSRSVDLEYALDRRRIVLADLAQRAEREPAAKERLTREQAELDTVQSQLQKARRELEVERAWADELAAGMQRLLEGLGPAARKKAQDQAWSDADDHPDWGVRAASVELASRLGGTAVATRIAALIERAHAERAKLQARYDKSIVDVRKLEQRLQGEVAASGGRPVPSTQQQYDRARRETGEIIATQTRLDAFVDSAARAGGRALARESGKELEASLQKLLSSIAKSKKGPRLALVRLLASCDTAEVRARLVALAQSEKDPAAIAALHDGLAELGERAIEPVLLESHLAHAEWLVRSSAATALARLRSKAAIPVMIERLEAEQGRVRSDLGRALTSLTGQDFRGNVELWRRWWRDSGASFEVPVEPQLKSAVEAAEEQRGVTFFGISTESQRVLFVLDLSGSMKFSMAPKNNPSDDPSRPYDMPGQGELSRLDVAKRDLQRAVGGLREGALFNMVLFASDVWSWADELIEMTPERRAEFASFVEKSDAVGATNIYGALERAFDLAGATGGDTYTQPLIDTIYLLTDGKATVGVTTEREEILAFVRSRNASAGITIHTIGLSEAHDAALLRRIADENGGQYVGR